MEDETMNNSNNNYLDSIPPGYRFCPDDHQLIAHYLQTKVAGGYILPGLFHDVNFYNYTPQQLYDKYKRKGQEAIYFFSPRNRRYPKGHRPDRRVRVEPNESIPDGKVVGFWKATGKDKRVRFKGIQVGTKRSLTYFEGTKVNEKKTNWLMQEFLLSNAPWNDAAVANEGTMLLDEWVLCKLYRNGKAAACKQKKVNHGEQQEVQNSNMPQPVNQNGTESAACPSLSNINAENPLMQLPAAGLTHDQNDGLMSRRPSLPNNNVGSLYYWDGNFMQPVLMPAMQYQDEGFTMDVTAMQEEAEINYYSMFPFSVPLPPPLRQPSSESAGS